MSQEQTVHRSTLAAPLSKLDDTTASCDATSNGSCAHKVSADVSLENMPQAYKLTPSSHLAGLAVAVSENAGLQQDRWQHPHDAETQYQSAIYLQQPTQQKHGLGLGAQHQQLAACHPLPEQGHGTSHFKIPHRPSIKSPKKQTFNTPSLLEKSSSRFWRHLKEVNHVEQTSPAVASLPGHLLTPFSSQRAQLLQSKRQASYIIHCSAGAAAVENPPAPAYLGNNMLPGKRISTNNEMQNCATLQQTPANKNHRGPRYDTESNKAAAAALPGGMCNRASPQHLPDTMLQQVPQRQQGSYLPGAASTCSKGVATLTANSPGRHISSDTLPCDNDVEQQLKLAAAVKDQSILISAETDASATAHVHTAAGSGRHSPGKYGGRELLQSNCDEGCCSVVTKTGAWTVGQETRHQQHNDQLCLRDSSTTVVSSTSLLQDVISPETMSLLESPDNDMRAQTVLKVIKATAGVFTGGLPTETRVGIHRKFGEGAEGCIVCLSLHKSSCSLHLMQPALIEKRTVAPCKCCYGSSHEITDDVTAQVGSRCNCSTQHWLMGKISKLSVADSEQEKLAFDTIENEYSAGVAAAAVAGSQDRLNHVIEMYGCGVICWEKAWRPILLMQPALCSLQDLLNRLTNQKQWLSAAVVQRFSLQMAQGIHQVHRTGRVHTDIKPANLLVTGSLDHLEQASIRLADMGCCKMNGYNCARDGPCAFTPDYAADEQLDMTSSLTFKADSVGFASTCLAMYCGTLPSSFCRSVWGSPHSLGAQQQLASCKVLMRDSSDERCSAGTLILDKDFAAMLTRCLVRDPSSRSSIADLLLDCRYLAVSK